MMFSTETSAVLDRADRKPAFSIPRSSIRQPDLDRFSFSERLDYIKAFGSNALAFSTLQPGMNYFDLPEKGFIAYRRIWGADMALADPVCAESDRSEIIGAFIGRHRNCAFIQASGAVAGLLSREYGFFATQFGIETLIHLPEWDLKGKKKQVLRTAANQAKKQGIVIREADREDRYRQISSDWLKTRKVRHREIHFLIRPMEIDYQKETRRFFAYDGEELIGFAFFDPLYAGRQIIGYIPNISRFRNSFKQGIFYAMMLHAIETFKAEGLEWVNLGLSPLTMTGENEPNESVWLKRTQWLLYNYANSMYNFQGLKFAKSRFGGREQNVYCCHREVMPAFKLLRLLKLLNIF